MRKKCGGRRETNAQHFIERVVTLRTSKCVKGSQRGLGKGGGVDSRGSGLAGTWYCCLYTRGNGAHIEATTMSPVMPTVHHCPLLPGEDIFAGSRATESGNFARPPFLKRTAHSPPLTARRGVLASLILDTFVSRERPTHRSSVDFIGIRARERERALSRYLYI